MISYDIWFLNGNSTKAYISDGITETFIPGTFIHNTFSSTYNDDNQTQITFLLRIDDAPVDFYVENAEQNTLQNPTASNFVRANIAITKISN